MEHINLLKSIYTNDFFSAQGRASRTRYWTFVLGNIVLSAVLGIIIGILGLIPSVGVILVGIGMLILSIWSIAVSIKSLLLSIQRMHDINKSGLFVLLAFVPIVGGIVVFVLTLLPSVDPNNYG